MKAPAKTLTARRLVAAAACCLALSACSVTAADLPLPGGGVEGETYQLHADLVDALNLPDRATVKLGGVRVGVVTRIATSDYRAQVSMDIERGVELPADTRIELRQATPLGDVFLALQPPERPKTEKMLADGDTIDIKHTSSAATIEDTLSAMAMLINGGGLAQLGPIIDELNDMLDGRAPTIRHVVREMDSTLATLNRRTADIDRVLKSGNEVATLAQQRRGTIDKALSELGPAVDAVSDNTGRISTTLSKAAATAETAQRFLGLANDDLKAILRDAGPVLGGFADLKDFRATLGTLVTLGKFIHGATEGEAGAGQAIIQAEDLITLVRYGITPGSEDIDRGLQTSLGTVLEFLDKVQGGTR